MKTIMARIGLVACACVVTLAMVTLVSARTGRPSVPVDPGGEPAADDRADNAKVEDWDEEEDDFFELRSDFIDEKKFRFGVDQLDSDRCSPGFGTGSEAQSVRDSAGKKHYVKLSADLSSGHSDTKLYFLLRLGDSTVDDKLRQWGDGQSVELWLRAEDKNKPGKSPGNLTGLSFDIGSTAEGAKTEVRFLAGPKRPEYVNVASRIVNHKTNMGQYVYHYLEIAVDYALFAKNWPAHYEGFNDYSGVRYCIFVRGGGEWTDDAGKKFAYDLSLCPTKPKDPKSLKLSDMSMIDYDTGQWEPPEGRVRGGIHIDPDPLPYPSHLK